MTGDVAAAAVGGGGASSFPRVAFFASASSLKFSARLMRSAFIAARDSGDDSSATATAFSRRLRSASRR